MRYTKILLLGMSALALAFGTAGAGLNPLNPGVGGALYNSGASRACVECHTRIPIATVNGLTTNGTHFVTAGGAADTHSGGGWNAALPQIIREGGQYFRLGQWPNAVAGRNAPFSKYATNADNVSHILGVPGDNTGMATQMATPGTFATYEIICESCHNVVSNVGGGNNLVAPMTSAAYVAGGLNQTTQTVGVIASAESTLCIGCHGFMYGPYSGLATGTTAAVGGLIGDARNTGEVTVAPRGNNAIHAINGLNYWQNHHVMGGDTISNGLAASGTYWADTLVKDISPAGWGPTGSPVNTTPGAGGFLRGTMPQLAVWTVDGTVYTGKTKPTTAATDLSCINCHSGPHAGDRTTAASILRDTNAGGINTGTSISRLGEGGRTYMGFDDAMYCNDCHTIR